MFLDVLHNDEGSLVLIQARGEPRVTVTLESGDPFEVHECREGYGRVYTCRDRPYTDTVTLLVDGKIHDTRVNKYPSFPDEIIVSTCVKNEDAYLIQWIEYHKILGITRFILYDNSDNTTNTHHEEPAGKSTDLLNLLENYISSGTVHIIKWPFHNHLVFQPGQINHSLQAFRKCRYIGFIDVDEYVNPQGPEIDLRKIFTDQCTNGGYSILCRNFQNFYRFPETGYKFLEIYTCDPILEGVPPSLNGEKIFACPRNVNTIVVHDVSNGLEPTHLPKEVMYFNHYKFLNKIIRGRGWSPMCDKSIKRIADLLNI